MFGGVLGIEVLLKFLKSAHLESLSLQLAHLM
jgi:hypothetical protein